MQPDWSRAECEWKWRVWGPGAPPAPFPGTVLHWKEGGFWATSSSSNTQAFHSWSRVKLYKIPEQRASVLSCVKEALESRPCRWAGTVKWEDISKVPVGGPHRCQLSLVAFVCILILDHKLKKPVAHQVTERHQESLLLSAAYLRWERTYAPETGTQARKPCTITSSNFPGKVGSTNF